MDKNKIQEILQAIEGINFSDWSRFKARVDSHFSSKADKLVLDDSSKLKINLEVDFNLRRFGDRSD
ncbi:hypothetical protein I858_015620 [Planococcus versutus]|uniref:Uncharacterized protein n=1 Tax=Planococcus versutus TaxID=1302659 RepID=A0A1B1S5F3_9BACL|nr:hypothetical protein I858_015620 [Planococcus versutus]